jgi:hypothetical protein
MAAGPKAQYAHLANLAADFVRKRPNRACPPPFRGRVARAREPSHREFPAPRPPVHPPRDSP